MRRSSLFFVTMMVLLAACARDKKIAETPTEPAADATTATATTAVENKAYLLYSASMQKQASSSRKVKNPSTGKDENNWLAALHRGEQVTLLGAEGEWSHVRSSDGTEGFIKTTSLLPGEGVTVAAVMDETKTFQRPTFLAPGKAIIALGTLVFVLRESPDKAFSEVNHVGSGSVWIESGKLSFAEREVAAAAIVSRARSLEERKDQQATQYWELAKSQFGDTQVVQKATTPAAESEAEAEAEATAAEVPEPEPESPAPAGE